MKESEILKFTVIRGPRAMAYAVGRRILKTEARL